MFLPQFARRKTVANGCGLMCVLVFVFVCFGCGPENQGPKNRASLSGTVSFAGQPLPGGSISFRAVDSHVATTAIISEGKYFTDRAPLGPVLVSVETESLKYGNASALVEIPRRYADVNTSELTVDVKPGENEDVNFALEK